MEITFSMIDKFYVASLVLKPSKSLYYRDMVSVEILLASADIPVRLVGQVEVSPYAARAPRAYGLEDGITLSPSARKFLTYRLRELSETVARGLRKDMNAAEV